MDTEMTTDSGSTDTSSTETSSTEISSLDATPTDNQGDNASLPTGDSATDQPAWTPNYEFTVKDKKLQFDELFKPLIKTKDVEAKLKDLYEKSYGLDEVKTSRDSFKTKFEEASQRYATTEQNLKTLSEIVKKGDFSTFFNVLNIPKDQIINYAIQELKFQELPPEQKAAIEQQRQQEQAFQQTQYENQTLQQQMQGIMVNQAKQELQLATSQPEVSQAAQSFDARVGRQGAFMSEVIKLGQYYEAVHKTSPPAQQLVQEVLNLVGAQSMSPQSQASAPQTTLGQGVAQSQKPVIPAFNGSNAKSPVRKAPGSIQDLKDLRRSL